MTNQSKTVEEQRLDEAREQGVPWKLWGRSSASGNGAPSARLTVRTAMRRTISPLRGLRRQLQDRVPNRFRKTDEPVRGGAGDH